MLVVKDRQCLGLVLLGFLVAQIGDGLVEINVGHGEVMAMSWVTARSRRCHAWWRWGWIPMGFVMFLGFCCDTGFFFFLIWVFVLVGFWWAVDSGGHGRGVVVVTRQ